MTNGHGGLGGAVLRMKRLRKAGLVILLVVCFTVGVVVWGGHETDSDPQDIVVAKNEEQLVRQEIRQALEDRNPATSEATQLKVSTEAESVITRGAPSSPESSDCLKWCRRGDSAKTPYYVVAVLLVRIYYIDPAGLTTREMLQWLQYLRYAGVEHVYVYDAYRFKNESQVKALEPFLDSGYVTYIDWSSKAYPYSIQGTQVAAYRHCMETYGKDTVWQAAIDIDEYPFSPSDTDENFLVRFLHQFSEEHKDAAEITMLNYLFLGKPLSSEEHPLLVDRLYRRTHTPANALVKPIYMPSRLSGTQVHTHTLGGCGHYSLTPPTTGSP